MKKIAIVLGLGVSGRSAAEYLLNRRYSVLGLDQNFLTLQNSLLQSLCLKGLEVASSIPKDTLGHVQFVVKSPGLPNDHPWIREIKQYPSIEIIDEIELACRELKDCGKKILAITGSNGKTTTTLLVTHILNSAGIKAKALGNIGTALTSELLNIETLPEVLVVELSSYQIEHLKTAAFDAALITNITPNHLDRYPSYLDYAKAKIRINECLKEKAPFFVQDIAADHFKDQLLNKSFINYGMQAASSITLRYPSITFDDRTMCTLPDEFIKTPQHDLENILAAFLLTNFCKVSAQSFIYGLKSFKKPGHRIEFVEKIDGVDYIDDSKATSVDAVIKAVESCETPIVLIVGGVDKGGAYAPWVSAFHGKVKKILAIGQAAEKIKSELKTHYVVEILENLESAVKKAQLVAEKGETVLLSPGCSSLDMFVDYKQRGEAFKKLVYSLKEEGGVK